MTSLITERVSKAAQPSAFVKASMNNRVVYYFAHDPGADALSRDAPKMYPDEPSPESYEDRVRKVLVGMGADEAMYEISFSVTNPQNQPIAIAGIHANVHKRQRLSYSTVVAPQTGGEAVPALQFDTSSDRPSGILVCRDPQCEVPKTLDALQKKVSYFGVRNVNVLPGNSYSFVAIVDGPPAKLGLDFTVDVIELDSRGDRRRRALTVRDDQQKDFVGVAGRPQSTISYALDIVNGGITRK